MLQSSIQTISYCRYLSVIRTFSENGVHLIVIPTFDIIVCQNSKVNNYDNNYHIYNCQSGHTELYFSQLSYISDILPLRAQSDQSLT